MSHEMLYYLHNRNSGSGYVSMNLKGFARDFLKGEPHTPTEWAERGDYLVTEDKLEDAVVHYERALALDPDNFRALWGKAGAVRRMGDLQGAKTLYQRILAFAPEDPQILLAAGYVHAVDGEDEDALQYYDRVLEKDPGNVTHPAAISSIARMRKKAITVLCCNGSL